MPNNSLSGQIFGRVFPPKPLGMAKFSLSHSFVADISRSHYDSGFSLSLSALMVFFYSYLITVLFRPIVHGMLWYVTCYLTCSRDTLFMASCYLLQAENLFIHTKFWSEITLNFSCIRFSASYLRPSLTAIKKFNYHIA